MLASPELMRCSAQANNEKGSTHNSSDTTLRCAHARGARGNRARVIATTTANARAPNAIRPATTCIGDNPVSPTLMNRKLEPHASASARNCSGNHRVPLAVVMDTPSHTAFVAPGAWCTPRQ